MPEVVTDRNEIGISGKAAKIYFTFFIFFGFVFTFLCEVNFRTFSKNRRFLTIRHNLCHTIRHSKNARTKRLDTTLNLS